MGQGLLLSLLLAAGPRHAAARGPIVAVGGNLHSEAVFKRIIELGGGPGKARVAIITAASRPPSEDPAAGTKNALNSRDDAAYWERMFKRYGATTVDWVRLDKAHPKGSFSPAEVGKVHRATITFFGGGSQEQAAKLLRPGGKDTPLVEAIRSGNARRQMVVAGSSAGAMVLGHSMITSGESFEALTRPPLGAGKGDSTGSKELTLSGNGLGLAPWVVDTHAMERGRTGRELAAAVALGQSKIVGIDENSAVVMTFGKRPRMEVLGAKGATFLDLTHAKVQPDSPLSATNVRMSYLTAGDRYYPESGRIWIRPRKKPIPQRMTNQEGWAKDIFSSRPAPTGSRRLEPRKLARITAGMFRAGEQRIVGHVAEGPSPVVTLERDRHSQAWQGNRNKPLSYRNVRLSVTRR
jgi:cyanophycinase